MIEPVGPLDRFVTEWLVARQSKFWEFESGRMVAMLDHDLLRYDARFSFVVQTELHKLAIMGIERLRALPNTDSRQGVRLSSFTQDQSDVTLELEGEETLRTDWLVGCDGGRGTVRSILDIPSGDFIWPERFAVLTVLDDKAAPMGCAYRCCFAGLGASWTNLFAVSGDDGRGRWRVVFPTRAEEDDEEAVWMPPRPPGCRGCTPTRMATV